MLLRKFSKDLQYWPSIGKVKKTKKEELIFLNLKKINKSMVFNFFEFYYCV
jgi:hypothetical protein